MLYRDWLILSTSKFIAVLLKFSMSQFFKDFQDIFKDYLTLRDASNLQI